MTEAPVKIGQMLFTMVDPHARHEVATTAGTSGITSTRAV